MACFKKIFSIFLGLTTAFIIGAAPAQYIKGTVPPQYDPNQYDQSGNDMLDRCKEQGAISLVQELMQNEQQGWNEVVQKTASGNLQWIWASDCLSHGVRYSPHERGDYAFATLMEAWAQALLKKPTALLERDREMSLTMFCSFPVYYEDQSVEAADDFLKKALAALETVEDDYLQRSKETCAFHLKLDHERFVNQLNEYKQDH